MKVLDLLTLMNEHSVAPSDVSISRVIWKTRHDLCSYRLKWQFRANGKDVTYDSLLTAHEYTTFTKERFERELDYCQFEMREFLSDNWST